MRNMRQCHRYKFFQTENKNNGQHTKKITMSNECEKSVNENVCFKTHVVSFQAIGSQM